MTQLLHRETAPLTTTKMMDDQRPSSTQIALDCGFSSSSQFCVVFKRITGTSPGEFGRAL
jgi:AraC-like DNA-binding protein